MVKPLVILWFINVAFSFWCLFRSHRNLQKTDSLLEEVAEFHAKAVPVLKQIAEETRNA